MNQPSSVYLRRFGRLGIIPFVLLLFVCIPFLSHITLDLYPKPDVTDGSYFRKLADFKSGLLADDFILVAVPVRDVADAGFAEVEKISTMLLNQSAVESVLSIATIKDEQAQQNGIDRYLQENPIMRQLLQSPDREMWSLLIFPKRGENLKDFAASVIENLPETDGLIVQGAPVYLYYGGKGIIRDYALLLPVAMLIVLLIECWFTRSFRIGFSMWLSAVFAMLVTLSLFPIVGVDLRIESLIVPIEVIILATSYGIHLHREWSLQPNRDLTAALSRISSVISVAALTTTLGFATLLLSKLAIIRHLGLFLMAGIIVAYISSVFFLPSMLTLFNVVPGKKSGDINVWVTDKGKLGLILSTAVITVLSLGIFRLYLDPRFITVFRKNNTAVVDFRQYQKHYVASDEIEVFIDTGREYGLVDIALNNILREFQEEIEKEVYVQSSLSFLQFVDWIRESDLIGASDPPTSAGQIGEALELLASVDEGLRLFSYMDIAYSKARIVFRLGSPEQSSREFSKVLAKAERLIQSKVEEFPDGITSALGGSAFEQLELSRTIIGGQMRGIAAFLCIIPVLLFFIFKKPSLVLLAMIPPIVSVLTYHGTMGVMLISVNIVTSITIAALLGVSVDDVILLIMNFVKSRDAHALRLSVDEVRARTGAAIIQTTLTIDIGLAVLFFSYYRHLAETALLSIIGLSMATLATLFIVPVLLKIIDRKAKGNLE